MTESELARFLPKVAVSSVTGCWEWTAYVRDTGYGYFTLAWYPTVTKLVHRLAYEHWVGPIPEDFDVDHLCRNRACVNPAHLEAVTHAENMIRAAAAHFACKHGHPLDGFRASGRRYCLTCNRLAGQRRREGLAA